MIVILILFVTMSFLLSCNGEKNVLEISENYSAESGGITVKDARAALVSLMESGCLDIPEKLLELTRNKPAEIIEDEDGKAVFIGIWRCDFQKKEFSTFFANPPWRFYNATGIFRHAATGKWQAVITYEAQS